VQKKYFNTLITFRGRHVSIPQEAYGLVWGDPALRFHQKYLNSCPKGLTGLEQHEGE